MITTTSLSEPGSVAPVRTCPLPPVESSIVICAKLIVETSIVSLKSNVRVSAARSRSGVASSSVGLNALNLRSSDGPSELTFEIGSVVCAVKANVPSDTSVCSNPARIFTDMLSAVSSPAVMV